MPDPIRIPKFIQCIVHLFLLLIYVVMERYSCTDEEIELIVEKGGADIYTEQVIL